MQMAFTNGFKKGEKYTLLHLMRVIARVTASTHANSLMRVKYNTRHFWGVGKRKMNERKRTSNLTVDHFPLTFLKLSLT